MSKFPSMPLFTDAFIADTGHLSLEEKGAYLMLLQFAWRSPCCRLPDDDVKLARMLGVSAARWARLKVEVMAFWTLRDGFWTQKRLQREYDFVTEKVAKKREAGSKGGRPKSFENKEMGEASGSENENQTESKPKAPTPTPTRTPKVPKGTEPPGFAEWWGAYPVRKGTNSRAAALDRYAQAVRSGATPETLLLAVRAYASEMRQSGKLNTEYVKQAQFFLSPKERHWEDYAAKAQAAGAVPKADPDAYLASLSDDRWRGHVRHWKSTLGDWGLKSRTHPPDDPRTKVPRHILVEFSIEPRAPPQSAAA